MAEQSQNLRGAIFMSIAMAGFVFNDACIKYISEDLSLFQIIFIRGVLSSAMMFALAWQLGAFQYQLKKRDYVLVFWRTVGEVGATFCFLTALFEMQIANVTAILQSLPLAVTLSAAVFLGQKVGWRRYIAIAVGCVGVLLIIQPGTEEFNAHSIWAIAAVAFVVLRDLVTTRLSKDTPTTLVALFTSVSMTVIAGVMTLILQDWQPVSGANFSILTVASVFLMIGYIAAVSAMRNGDVAFVSPFRYSVMIWAILLDIFLFNNQIDNWKLIGTAIVIGMGIYSFYREGQISRKLANQ